MEKEARRRRIVERGSDRLALITGRIQNLESPLTPSPNSHNYSHTRTHSAPAAVIANNDLSFSQDQEHHLHGEADLSSLSLNYDLGDGVSRGDAFQNITKLSKLQSDQKNTEETQDSTAATYVKHEAQLSAIDTKVTQASDDDAEMSFKSGGKTLLNCLTAKEINSCIVSSEDTRVFCSIMIALLVVIAYANLPRHIVKSKSLIASRPLYVLLLTDVMIVILRITYAKHRGSGEMDKGEKQERNLQEDGSNNWDDAIKVLEWGLVLYQSVRAIFIDCSFYIVIIICGFSFM